MEKVSSVKCTSYDLEEVYIAVKEGLERIGFTIPKNKTVLIKPNILAQNKPNQHSITHYTVVDALCRLLTEKDCKILIGESVAFYQKDLTTKAFKTSKIADVAKKYGAKLIAFEEEPLVRISSDIVGLDEIYIPKILLEVDLTINACKLKTHSGLRLSGAIKNMYGCLPGGYKQKIHIWTNNDFELSNVFIDIHKIVKPMLSVMDAVVALDGGPSAIGKPVKTSSILVSENATALDVVACKKIGYEPTDIATLICAKERKMIKNFEDIEVIGEVIPVKFKRLIKGNIKTQKKKDGIYVTRTYVNPVIKECECNKCGECIEPCPVNAIELIDDNISINLDTCINCYYCLSVCPEGAIKVNSSLTNKLIRVIRFVTRI